MKGFRLRTIAALISAGMAWSQSEQAATPQETAPPAPESAAHPKDDGEDSRDRVIYSDETEQVKPLTIKLVRNILLDQKDIWTSPFHIKKKDIVPLMVFGASLGVLIANDQKIATQLPNTVDQVAISKDVSNVGAVYTVLPITVGFYIGGVIGQNAKARETGVLAGEAVLDTLIVAGVLKVATQRPRPLYENGRGDFFKGGDSFPSGHSIESWALAAVVAHEYSHNIIIPITAYGLASLVSFSRLSGQQHFASDILAGAGIGFYIGRYVVKTHDDHALHRHASAIMHPQIIPQFQPETRTRGVMLSWQVAE
jgi:membrane-associated phospholipid phosphatase